MENQWIWQTKTEFITGKLKKKCKYYILSSNEKIHQINGDTIIFNLKNNNVSFKFLENLQDTIYLTDNEELYNPLIDHCSDVNIYLDDSKGGLSSFRLA